MINALILSNREKEKIVESLDHINIILQEVQLGKYDIVSSLEVVKKEIDDIREIFR